MNKLITMIAIFTTFATAKAESPVEEYKEFYGAIFESLSINHSWLLDATSGSVIFNVSDATITLKLAGPMQCPSNLACPAMMVDVLDVELEIVNQYSDSCGAIIYEAQKNQTLADGLLQNVQVVDNQYMICEIAPAHLTEVTYSTYNPWTQETVVSNFGAGSLSPIPTTF